MRNSLEKIERREVLDIACGYAFRHGRYLDLISVYGGGGSEGIAEEAP